MAEPSHALDLALRLLTDTVEDDWESLEQVLRDHGDADFGDQQQPGTAAWHVRHTVEVFRLHARTTMRALGASEASLDAIGSQEDALPAGVVALREALRSDVRVFCDWARTLGAEAMAARFDYGRDTDLAQMLGVMTRHITWHCAAAHYWHRWCAGS